MSELIKIEMPEEEVQTYLAFKENQDIFDRLIKGKVHELVASKAILNFDGRGVLTEIRVEVKTYKETKAEKLQ